MSEALLNICELYKSFGSVIPVKGISFSINRGSCTALLGPNGAGKTTTLRMLAGLIEPGSGAVEYTGSRSAPEWRSRIGYLPQYPKFYPWMNGREYITFCARVSGLKGSRLQERVDAVLEQVGLKEASRRRISGYSGGMKQRLGLAQALVHEPEILFLDEPVSALDPLGRREVMELIRGLRGENVTILFSTHVLHDAEEICDEMIFMVDGGIAEQGPLSALRDKYRQPVIHLEVDSAGSWSSWLDSLKSRPFVTEAAARDNHVQLKVTDMDIARKSLMQDISARGIPLIRFEAGTSTLEEMFMEVVSR